MVLQFQPVSVWFIDGYRSENAHGPIGPVVTPTWNGLCCNIPVCFTAHDGKRYRVVFIVLCAPCHLQCVYRTCYQCFDVCPRSYAAFCGVETLNVERLKRFHMLLAVLKSIVIVVA